MNHTLILDEQLDSDDLSVSRALNVLATRFHCYYRAVRHESPGISDDAIPAYCKSHGIAALVSANTQDFAAKRELFRRLLEAGVSVVAISSKNSLTPERQVAILAVHTRLLAKKLTEAAAKPILLRLTETRLVEHTLESLAAPPSKKKLP